MALKFHGYIGFAIPEEIRPGVYKPNSVTRKEYGGDILRLSRNQSNNPDSTNDNITMSVVLSIVADPFFNENMASLLYVEYMGTKWKVSNIDPTEPPVLKLTLGGIYNGQ